MSYIIYVIGYGYFGGYNTKYHDMFNITGLKFAKKLNAKETESVKQMLKKAGYDFKVDEVTE